MNWPFDGATDNALGWRGISVPRCPGGVSLLLHCFRSAMRLGREEGFRSLHCTTPRRAAAAAAAAAHGRDAGDLDRPERGKSADGNTNSGGHGPCSPGLPSFRRGFTREREIRGSRGGEAPPTGPPPSWPPWGARPGAARHGHRYVAMADRQGGRTWAFAAACRPSFFFKIYRLCIAVWRSERPLPAGLRTPPPSPPAPHQQQ